MEKPTFFKLYYPAAVQCQRDTGIPAIAILAQAAVESGWGEKAPGNMFFGIKADASWKGKRQLITTREVHKTKSIKYPEIISITLRKDGKYDYKVKDWFRAYDNAAESFTDHGKFFLENPRYERALQAKTAEEFVDEVAKAGYATDPGYAKLWKGVIEGLEPFLPKSNPIS